jgi:hypothetical protein
MKKRNLFLILGLSFLTMAPSEMTNPSKDEKPEIQTPCTDESVKNAQGKWTVDPFKSLPANPALPALINNLEKEADLVHKALGEPAGFDAKCYFWISGDPFAQKTPKQMEVNVPFYHYYCADGKLGVDSEYSDGILVYANSTWPMGGIGGIKLGTKTFRTLGSPIGEINGYPAFEADWTGSPAGITFNWIVLVTKKEKPLFRYASKAEILDHLVNIVEKKRPENLADVDKYMLIRPEEVQAEERKKELASFLDGANSDDARKSRTERFNKDYRSDLQKREETKKKISDFADKVAANLATVRARYTPEQLKEPGYVEGWLLNYNTDFGEEDFDFVLPKTDPYCRPNDNKNCPNMGKPLAILQGGYYDTNLPSTSPQYFTVAFKWTAIKSENYRNVKAEKLRDDFFARLDFDQLSALLGK